MLSIIIVIVTSIALLVVLCLELNRGEEPTSQERYSDRVSPYQTQKKVKEVDSYKNIEFSDDSRSEGVHEMTSYADSFIPLQGVSKFYSTTNFSFESVYTYKPGNPEKVVDKRRCEFYSVNNTVSTTGISPTTTSTTKDRPAVTVSRSTFKDAYRREKAVRHKFFGYIDSIELSLKYPLMRDTSHELIIALNFALSHAKELRATHVDDGSDVFSTPYGRAVLELEKAFVAAEGTALHMRQSALTVGEQKNVQTAQKLLHLALNQSSSPNERVVAYKKVLKIMDELSMPATERARLDLESHNDVLQSLE